MYEYYKDIHDKTYVGKDMIVKEIYNKKIGVVNISHYYIIYY